MSIKIRMVIGFVIVLVMVSMQSFLIISLNGKKDALSAEILQIYQINTSIKDRLLDITLLQNDLLNRINWMIPVPEETHEQQPASCLGIIQSLEQWRDSFRTSDSYIAMTPSRREQVNLFLSQIDELRGGIDEIREIDSSDSVTRMNVYDNMVSPAAIKARLSAVDIVGANTLFFAVKKDSMLAYSRRIAFIQFSVIALVLSVIIAFIFYSQYLLSPLGWLMQGVRHITRGDFSSKVKTRGKDELGILAEQFNVMSDEIKNHREHLEDLVRSRTDELREAKNELEVINANLIEANKTLEEARRMTDIEMAMAASVQGAFFMEHPPVVEGWDISLKFLPMNKVSGDVYDFYVDDRGRLLGLSMMDVSGHGIASGLVAMLAKSVSSRIFMQECKSGTVAKILEKINDELTAEINNVDSYLTAIMLKTDNSRIEYCNAAHTDLIIKRAKSSARIVKPSGDEVYKALFLGIDDMKMPIKLMSFDVAPGDTLFLFTDGLCEAFDSCGSQFGTQRILSALDEAGDVSPDEIIAFVTCRMKEFQGESPLKDDLTIICMKKR